MLTTTKSINNQWGRIGTANRIGVEIHPLEMQPDIHFSNPYSLSYLKNIIQNRLSQTLLRETTEPILHLQAKEPEKHSEELNQALLEVHVASSHIVAAAELDKKIIGELGQPNQISSDERNECRKQALMHYKFALYYLSKAIEHVDTDLIAEIQKAIIKYTQSATKHAVKLGITHVNLGEVKSEQASDKTKDQTEVASPLEALADEFEKDAQKSLAAQGKTRKTSEDFIHRASLRDSAVLCRYANSYYEAARKLQTTAEDSGTPLYIVKQLCTEAETYYKKATDALSIVLEREKHNVTKCNLITIQIAAIETCASECKERKGREEISYKPIKKNDELVIKEISQITELRKLLERAVAGEEFLASPYLKIKVKEASELYADFELAAAYFNEAERINNKQKLLIKKATETKEELVSDACKKAQLIDANSNNEIAQIRTAAEQAIAEVRRGYEKEVAAAASQTVHSADSALQVEVKVVNFPEEIEEMCSAISNEAEDRIKEITDRTREYSTRTIIGAMNRGEELIKTAKSEKTKEAFEAEAQPLYAEALRQLKELSIRAEKYPDLGALSYELTATCANKILGYDADSKAQILELYEKSMQLYLGSSSSPTTLLLWTAQNRDKDRIVRLIRCAHMAAYEYRNFDDYSKDEAQKLAASKRQVSFTDQIMTHLGAMESLKLSGDEVYLAHILFSAAEAFEKFGAKTNAIRRYHAIKKRYEKEIASEAASASKYFTKIHSSATEKIKALRAKPKKSTQA